MALNTDRKKLSPGQIHILQLIRKSAKEDGWVPVSKCVSQLFTNKTIPGGAMPEPLCEYEDSGESGRVRLTVAGNNVLDAMEWLPYSPAQRGAKSC